MSEKLAKMIQAHRKKAGLSRMDLAHLSGVGKTTIFDLEHGRLSVRFDTLLKLLSVLNIQVRFDSPLMKELIDE